MPSRQIAREALKIESDAVKGLISRLDENFDRAVEAIYRTTGRVVVMGMGKPGLIAQKISATLASTGSPSLFLHPAEAVHGDLGNVTKEDIVIAISNSGETDEVVRVIPLIKEIGSRLIAMTGNTRSTLAKNSDIVLDVGVKKEACPMGLAPTASTTATLAMGDALAVALIKRRGFKESDYAKFHPGGMLGKRLLLKVEDIMRKGLENPVVDENALVKDVLVKITGVRAGSASIVDKKGKLTGIFTDGDLRRNLESGEDLLSRKVKDAMTHSPKTITKEKLAAEALRILKENRIDEIPVVDNKNKPIGLIDVQDLLKAGLA